MAAAAAVMEPLTPSVTWAQRSEIIFITINVADVTDPIIEVAEKSIYFKGKSNLDGKVYAVSMKLLKEIIPDKAKHQMGSKCVEFVLEKVNKGPFWNRLLEDKRKQRWLKKVDLTDDMEKRISTMKDVVKPKSKDKMMDDIMKNMSKMSVGGNTMKIPDFHLEYAKRFKEEGEHFEKLSTINKEFQINTIVSSSVELAAKSIHDQGETAGVMMKRWGMNLTDARFQEFLTTAPLHSIFDKETCPVSSTRFSSSFQTMKNYNVPEWMYEFGKTHVSIGCVDFQQLLLGRLLQNSRNALNFVGIDSSLISIARCEVLYQMMKNNADPRSVLQVWFSTAWTSEALKDFKQAIVNLLLSDAIEDQMKGLLKHWKDSSIKVENVKEKWSQHYLQPEINAPFGPCANLKTECDRVDYARYLFTGIIFIDESLAKHGNVTMFSIPDSFGAVKVPDENFYYTFNYSHRDFAYDGTLMKSIDNLMMKKTEDLIDLVRRGRVKMRFKTATVSLESKELLQEIKEMNAYTIDWSNVPDYFSKDDFLKIARATSGEEDTVHYLHFMNWVQSYQGAIIFDYKYKDKLGLVKTAFDSMKNVHQMMLSMDPNYRRMWPQEMKNVNDINVTNASLGAYCSGKYLEYFFGKEINFSKYPITFSPFQRGSSTICCAFTFDKEISFQSQVY